MWKLRVAVVVFWFGSLSCPGSMVMSDVLSDSVVAVYKSVFKAGLEDSTTEDDKTGMSTSMESYVSKHGYPVETHTVTTEDGYLLTLHRIPGSPKAASGGVKTPVLVLPGISVDPEVWVMLGPEKGLGFLLADQGYDVWLGNYRGNTYSKNHTRLSIKDPQFWNFTWHEMGVYDLPAMIDYILDTTAHNQLMYIGHSMGSTSFFVMASSRPEYNQKIRLVVAVTPVVFFTDVDRVKSFRAFHPLIENFYRSARKYGIHEILYRNTRIHRLINTLCKRGPTQVLCLLITSGAFGSNPSQMNKTLVPLFLTKTLSGSSIDVLLHYAQTLATGRFQRYDHSGRVGNKMEEYDLSQVTCPVSLVYALNDPVARPEDVFKLNKTLNNVVQMTEISDKLSTHLDFITAKDAKQLYYDGILDTLEKYRDLDDSKDINT